ncbi:MAG TPA: hypothetical protein VGK79_15510 [Gaiellaceae bacterium]
MRTRSAAEWRDFWAERGERELAELLGDLAPHATRIATLLGSRAPQHALAAELGRIRDAEPDHRLAARIHTWFEHA